MFAKVPLSYSETVAASKTDTGLVARRMLLDPTIHPTLSNLAAQTETQIKQFDHCQHLFHAYHDPILNDIVEELFFEEAIDGDMICDFCSKWAPNIQDKI